MKRVCVVLLVLLTHWAEGSTTPDAETCSTRITDGCSSKGGFCVIRPFQDNCGTGTLKERACTSKHCQCCIPYIPPSCDGKMTKKCKKNDGTCVMAPFKANCDGKLSKKGCKGKDCQCCIPIKAPSCAGKITNSCTKKGGSCVLAPFADNCKAGKLSSKACKGKDCQCCVPEKAPSCVGKLLNSCAKKGGHCVLAPFQDNCRGKLIERACSGASCQCCIPDPTVAPTVAPKPTTAAPPNPTTAAPPNPTTAAPPKPTTAAPPKPTTASPPKPTTATPPKPTTAAPPKPTTAAPPIPTTAAPPKPTTGPPATPAPPRPAPPKPKTAAPTTLPPTPKPTTAAPTTLPPPPPTTAAPTTLPPPPPPTTAVLTTLPPPPPPTTAAPTTLPPPPPPTTAAPTTPPPPPPTTAAPTTLPPTPPPTTAAPTTLPPPPPPATCPQDFSFKGLKGDKCLYVNAANTVKWEDARDACTAKNARLIEPTDFNEFKTFADTHYNGKQFWLGATDKESEGTWVWQSGEAVQSGLPWGPGQPDNYWFEDCLGYPYKEGYNDYDCGSKLHYICETCPTGYALIGSQCLSFNTDEQLSWQDARDKCQSKGDSIAVVKNTEALQTYIEDNYGVTGRAYFWLGGTKSQTQVTWRNDGRCGSTFPLANGAPSICNPNSGNSCCSPHNWCGGTANHCTCSNCKNYAGTPLARYYGPHSKIWDDSQCANIGSHSGTLAECKDVCDGTAGCTAMNFNGNSCVLRDCGSPVPEPAWDYAGYVGYSKVSSEWVWVNGVDIPVSSIPWGPNEPNNSGGQEDCFDFITGHGYNDNACSTTSFFVCNKGT